LAAIYFKAFVMKKNNKDSNQPQKHDDNSDDNSINEMLKKEIRIDPGNEHYHRTDADDKIFDDDIDRSPRNEPDARGDNTEDL
jgi:hypothetical protein